MGLGSTGLSILSFFVVIGPLIFFHELGHFLAARWNNIQVEEFGIGYPPRMLTLFEQKGTKFTLNWLPFGGFMRPLGEDDPAIGGGFASSSKLARFTVLTAGPGANIIIAFLLLVIMFMTGAPIERAGAQIDAVEPDSPAAEGGLQEGDIIIGANGVDIDTTNALIEYISRQATDAPGEPIVLTVQRGSETLELEVTPRVDPPEGQGPTGIRVRPPVEVEHFGLFGAISKSLELMWTYTKAFVELPAAAIRGEIDARLIRPVSIVGISEMGGAAIDMSLQNDAAWPVIQLTAVVSLALAITNLLPLPALDGGRIFFVLIEAIRGRRIDPQRETMVHLIGFAILLTTMIVFVYLDIVDPLVPR